MKCNKSGYSELTTLKLSPVFLDKIWGGHSLRTKLNKQIPENLKVGESWEISGEPDHQTIVADGKFEGKKLGDLCKKFGDKILGTADIDSGFPLLYKFIDANDKLSVQVHPDDLQAIGHGWGSRGKTECWYVIDAPAGASIIVGLKKDISEEEMLSAIELGTFKGLLNEEKIAPGDLLFIPAGTIHAILSNTLIFEVQESSDITLRVYDWNRLDNNGKPRELHIKEAIEVANKKAYGSFKIKPLILKYENYTHSYRVASRYFAIEQFSFHKSKTIDVPQKKSFSVITMITGKSILTDMQKQTSVSINKGESVVIPACCNQCTISVDAQSEFLLSSVPDLKEEIIDPLLNLRIPVGEIIQLGGAIPEKNDLMMLLKSDAYQP